MAWELVSLDDIVDMQYGYTASAESEPVGPKFLRITDIVPDIIDWNSVPYCRISDSDYEKYRLKLGDIVIARTGATAGYAKLIRKKVDAVFASYLIRLTPKSPKVLPEYLGRVIESTTFKEFIDLVKGGSAQPQANAPVIKRFQLALPPKHTQAKITAVLSTYDNLIENNTRRIAILEEMAQALYREWFVHFRFPGHEGVEMVEGGNGNGRNGRVPEGWEIRPFSEIADVLSGGTPKTKVPEYWNGEIPFFSPKDHNGSFFISQTERYITKLGLNKCNSKLYPPNTVFITARGTVGKVIMPSVHMAMNQSCYALQGRDGVHQLYIFLSIMNHVEQLKQRAHGAVFDTIIVDTFSKLEIVKPPPNILNEFVTKVEPIFDLIRNLLDKNANLRQTRDLLLPRLISGELDVSHIPVAEVSLPRSPHTTNTR